MLPNTKHDILPVQGDQATQEQVPEPEVKKDFRGVWVATVVNIDYPSKPTTDPEILKSEALRILDHAKATGLNAVFLQVRPTADALYYSKYYPWSKYLTGAQGTAPSEGFDPLAFWVDEAHSRGLELHAWINPYRVTKKTSKEPKHDFASLAASNPAKLNPSWVVKHSDGNLYFDPGIPEVRKLVVDGVVEIIENYDVDGIHLDDYFYPDKKFNDAATFKKYGSGFSNIDDWRRENVNLLVKELSQAVKAARSDVSFGISPFGIWANKASNPLGSDTNGLQAYYDHYADTRKWVKEGMIDYIAPQLYWNIGFSVADYKKLLSWWQDTVKDTGVDLYIGQAAYRAVSADPKDPWYGPYEIERQLKLNEESPEVKGSIFFSCKSLMDNPALSAVIKGVYDKRDGIAAEKPVAFGRPTGNISTSYSQYYINGTSDPKKPLLLNGKPVENRSAQGHFGILVPLEKGANAFTIYQEGSYETRMIYRETASTGSEKMSKAEIPASSAFPQSQAYRAPGEKITFYCKAPAGSKVTVKLGNKSYEMKPSQTSKASGLYAVSYSYTYTIPSYSDKARVIDLGTPVYTMNYKGIVKSTKAPAKIGVIMKGSPYYAKVEKDVIYTYESAASSNGAVYELYKGMVDYVTGMSGGYVRLSSGQWVKREDVKLYIDESQQKPKIQSAVYETGEKWDVLRLKMSGSAAATADFDGKQLKFRVSMAESDIAPVLAEASPFEAVAVSKSEKGTEYNFTLKTEGRIEGYYVENSPEGLALYIRKPVKAASEDENKPLKGIRIMLDPGHGGTDASALGPLGLAYAEKDINLKTSLKLEAELEALGAEVLMTRRDDRNVSLEERLSASRSTKPDMFISLHANSMEDNVDISKIDGFSVFYRDVHAKPLSEAVYTEVVEGLGRNKKGVRRENFYVIRGTWTPSILVESGFVPNPNEFEWLTDENEQLALAKTIAKAIVEYFR